MFIAEIKAVLTKKHPVAILKTMNKPRRTIEKLIELGNLHGMPFRDIASKTKIDPSTLSKLQGGRRPSERILRNLCSIWSEDENIELLIEHLRDEIARAGYSPMDINVLPTGQPPTLDSQLDRALKNLRELALKSSEIRQVLLDLDIITQVVDAKRLGLKAGTAKDLELGNSGKGQS